LSWLSSLPCIHLDISSVGQDERSVPTPAPLIIGATGGSGTRVVARLAQRAGYNLGNYVNEANDALAFRPFHERWINRFLEAQNRKTKGADETEQMTKDFRIALAQHLESNTSAESRWGWKAPRSIYLLPFFQAQFPELKFIHVLRDGRDMAFSKNQNQLRKHGARVLSWRERWLNTQPVRSILLWARVNLQAAEFGEARLANNYLTIRFEDLCQKPLETTARLLRFLDADLDAESIAGSEIAPPSSIGRWQAQPATIVSKLERATQVALRKFGYLD
jgi:hypothetical protein